MTLYFQTSQTDACIINTKPEGKTETCQGDTVQEDDKPIIVMVLGAGRGPLVRATLNAADITGTKVKVRNTNKYFEHV